MRAAAVGKKKKIYVYASRKKEKSLLIPGLIVAGVFIFYFINKSSAQSSVTVVPTPTPEPGTGTGLPTESGGQAIIPGGGVVTTNPTGFNSLVRQYQPSTQPVITVNSSTGLTPQGTQYLNGLLSEVTDPTYKAAFRKMTDKELYYAWWYWANYLSHGIPLLEQTKALPTGQWDNSNPGNPELYNAVVAIHSKYGIF